MIRVGDKYGMLTVTGRAPMHTTSGGRRVTMYACKCDCGNSCIVASGKLKHRESCGCVAAKRKQETIKKALQEKNRQLSKKREALAGENFGNWIVIGEAPKSESGLTMMLCKCRKCGAEKTVTLSSLRSGKSTQCKSCGQKEINEKFIASECKDGTRLCGLTQKTRIDSSTGVKGVYVNHRNGKYVAQIKLAGKKYWLGEFSTLEEASKRRKAAESILFDPILEKYGREKTDEIRREHEQV